MRRHRPARKIGKGEEQARKDSSFAEEKETKRLLPIYCGASHPARAPSDKSFLVLFSKNRLAFLPPGL